MQEAILASYPVSFGKGEKELGYHCLCMCVIIHQTIRGQGADLTRGAGR